MPDDAPPKLTTAARGAALVVAASYALLRLTTIEYWDLVDDLDLAIHEAGHLAFQPFGEPMLTLGGSLFQVMVPLLFVGYFAWTRQRFAAFMTLNWVGVNLLNVARYVGDARAQDLPLLGGEDAVHDWWYLLTEWDRLPQDTTIAGWLRGGAALVFLTAALGGAIATLIAAQSRSDAPG